MTKKVRMFLFFSLFVVLNVFCYDVFCKDKIEVKKNREIINFETKIDNQTLTYKDVFETDFGEFNEKNNYNNDILDDISAKIKYYAKHCKKDKNNSCIDNIVKNNIDNIVAKILDKKNMKYGLFGTNNAQWFEKDGSLKSSLNYIQQKFLLFVSCPVLEKISIKIMEDIIEHPDKYIISFSSMWVVYGNGHKLEKSFDEIKKFISNLQDKINSGIKLSNKDVLMLHNIYRMKDMENIITNDPKEYISKKILLSKTKSFIKQAGKMIEDNKNNIKNRLQ